ncbi:MAG: O-antigen ligase family protein, partial [bacterium]|nr:O-antigen ligase family protein [bacterium]
KEYRLRITPLFFAICVLFAAIVISGAFGVNAARSIWSVPERMTGIVLMAHLVGYFAVLGGMHRVFSWKRYIQVSIIISFFTALFPVIQLILPTIFFDRLSAANRLSGTVGNPIFLSSYLLCHIFFSAWLTEKEYKEGGRWWPYALIGGVNSIVIILTQTRSTIIAIAVSFAVLSGYAVLGKGSGKARNAVYAVWILAILFAGTFWLTRSNALWRDVPILNRLAQEGFRSDGRLIAWKAGLQVFTEHPVTGVGWDNFYTALNAHYDPRLLRNGFTETFFDRPHNIFVQFLSETGVIGFSAYLFLIGCAFYAARRNKWIVTLVAAYLTQNFFAFDSISNYIVFFLVLAFIDAGMADSSTDVVRSESDASFGILIPLFIFIFAFFGIYFFSYRAYAASRLEWKSVNYFVNAEMTEGLEYMDKALNAPTPYHSYIAKDLYPNIALFYKQNLPLPDARNLVARAVKGMTETAEAEPLNYGFWIGLADMMPPIAGLDGAYIDQGLAALDRADSISPRRQATLYIRAKLLNLKGDKAGALKAMADAVALDPEVGDAHFYYGLLLLESSDKDGGVRELALARKLGREPKNEGEAVVAAGQLGDLGAYKESAYYFKKALFFTPDSAELIMRLGLVYYFDGNRDAAREFIGQVMKREDITKSVQYQLIAPILRDLGLLK